MSDRKDKYGAPNIIYLQLHGDDDPDLADAPFVDCTQDISWCWEMINEFDVEYIRIDLHKEQIESLQSQLTFTQSIADKEKATKEKIVIQLAAVEKERDELVDVSKFVESEYLNEDDAKLTTDAQLLKYKGLFKKLEAKNAELKIDVELLENRLANVLKELTESEKEKAKLQERGIEHAKTHSCQFIGEA